MVVVVAAGTEAAGGGRVSAARSSYSTWRPDGKGWDKRVRDRSKAELGEKW